MDYEKVYKEALERAMDAYKDTDRHLKATIERIFPELKESEDERIRKELISFISDRKNWFPKEETKTSWLAWLEKQGEQKLLNNDKYQTVSVKTLDRLYKSEKELEQLKQGKQKPVECIKLDNEFENQISHLIASVLNGEHEYNEGFVKYVSQSLLGFAKKEQKPAEWSEEELTEFEKELEMMMVSFSNGNLGSGVRKEMPEQRLHDCAHRLLDLAREELQQEFDKEMDKRLAETSRLIYLKGHEDTLKELPKWKKANEHKEFAVHVCVMDEDMYPFLDTEVHEGEYYIELSDLKTLPKEE